MNRRISAYKNFFIFSPLLLTGCASMFTHNVFSDDAIRGQSQVMALGMKCVESGLAPGEPVYAYGQALSQLFTVSVYNKVLYENSYKAAVSAYSNYFPPSHASECGKVEYRFPQQTAVLRAQYNDIATTRRMEMSGLGQQLSQGIASPAGTIPQYNSAPVAGSTYSQSKENSPKHYLVNTGSGSRLCTATDSGYVYCN